MIEKITKRLSRKRVIVFGGIILGLIVVSSLIVFFLSKLNQPVSSAVSSANGSIDSTYYNIDLTPVKRTGAYVSFNSPKGLPLVSRSLISAISVEDFDFYAKDIYSWSLAIDIIKTPTGALSESSSYNLRKGRTSQYSENIETINGKQYDVMTDTSFSQGFSKVAYTTHGDLVGIISLIGNDTSGTGPLATTFNMVLGSWQWLQ